MPYDLCDDDPTLDIIETAMANRGRVNMVEEFLGWASTFSRSTTTTTTAEDAVTELRINGNSRLLTSEVNSSLCKLYYVKIYDYC